MKFRSMMALLAIGFTLAGCSPSSKEQSPTTLERISANKTLRVGYVVFPPCVTKDPNTQQLGGHFVATIEEIARQTGWKTEYTEVSWSTFAAGLSSGRFDVSIAPTFVTIPRALAVSFTRPLLFAGNSAIARNTDKRFRSIQDVDRPDITISVTEGEAGHEYAKAHLTKAKIVVHPGSDQMLAFQDVLSGRSDLALGDAYVTSKFAALHKDKIIDLYANNPYNLTPVSWSVRSGDIQFLEFLNASIESLDSQGKLTEFETEASAHWLHLKKEWQVF